jgi:hypothetical protein
MALDPVEYALAAPKLGAKATVLEVAVKVFMGSDGLQVDQPFGLNVSTDPTNSEVIFLWH